MIYIPMLKTRSEELRILKGMRECFTDKIIPLIEIISEQYQVRYKTDENGEFIREKHKSKYYKVKCKPTEQDIITLQQLNAMVDDRKMFVDYFRFSLVKYGKNIDIAKAELAYNLNNNYALYKQKVLSVTQYKNMIPVISVKQDYNIPVAELKSFLTQLQENAEQVALRITEDWLEVYEDIICDQLRENDYLLFDVEEQNPGLKFVEIEKLKDYQAKCKIILLNSPRKLLIKNGEYPEHDKTDLIDNCARIVAEEYILEGYGDYCGLKDTMPLNSGSNGTGAALALFYDYEENVFYSFCNHDTSLGMQGYADIIPVIKADETILNKSGDCPGYEILNKLEGTGNWNTWHHVNAVRYIYQISKNM